MIKNENEEDKLLIDKVLDKKYFAESKKKIANTLFLNAREQMLINKNVNLDNSFYYGVLPNAERKILVFYPDKLTEELVKKKMGDIVSVIRITLPNENKGKYEHKNYLSGLMKIGLERERIGDIIVTDDGADIILISQNKEYTLSHLRDLTRFKKAKIEEIDIQDVHEKQDNFQDIQIIIPSMRIDNLVAELARCSRTKALEIIEEERVFINYETIYKASRSVNIGDIITIRGKGKFIISEELGSTRKDNIILLVKKYS